MPIVHTETYCLRTVAEHTAIGAKIGVRTEGGHVLHCAAVIQAMQVGDVDFGTGVTVSPAVYDSIMTKHLVKDYDQVSDKEVLVRYKLVPCLHGAASSELPTLTKETPSDKETRH